MKVVMHFKAIIRIKYHFYVVVYMQFQYILIDETNGNNIINIPSHANLSASNDDLSLSTPEQTDGEESTSAPTEYLAEVNE